VVASGMLRNPSLEKWLGGIEPAWTMLDRASFAALHRPPSPMAGPIRLASDLTQEEIQQSAVTRNALVLLRAAAAGSGLKMTATGNLSRSVVAQMCDLFTWPDFDRSEAFQFNKVINEPDFLPLFFVRHIAEAGKLLRKYKGHLKITPAGRQLLEASHRRALQAVLFHTAFWYLELDYLGLYFHHGWPQRHIGVVLWSLSVGANGWQSSGRLTRICTIPVDGVVDTHWDRASYTVEAKILRPLLWFGLLEHREDDIDGSCEKRHLYRKTALFDRFLAFDVTLEIASSSCH
jgi:hypothetical protein